VLGAAITLAFVAMAIVAWFWTPYDPAALHIVDKLQAPDWHHWFGTDQLGRDVLSMIMAGAKNSVGVALLSVVIGVVVGVPLGLLAAARGGAFDELVMRGNDLVFAFPSLLLAILITAVFGPGAVNAIIAIGIFNIPVFARVTRAGALGLWTRDYTLAARVAGKGTDANFRRAHPAESGRIAGGAGNHSVLVGRDRRGGLVLCRPGRTAAHPELGAHAERCADSDRAGAIAGLYPGFAVLFFVLGLNLLGDGLKSRRAQ
jgi:peptide/nickel transport system permease protein